MIHVAQANHTGNMNDTIPAMGTRKYAFMVEECKAIRKVLTYHYQLWVELLILIWRKS